VLSITLYLIINLEYLGSLIFLILFKMKKTIVLLIAMFFCVSCKKAEESTDKKNSITEIDMSIGHNEKKFCELVEELSLVKLETTKHSLIGGINQIEVFDNKIFVHDLKTQYILIFEYPTGNYINKVESIGNGPGEYFNISSFSIEKDERLLALLDINLRKIFKFNFEGEFIDSKTIPFYAHSFSYMNDDENVIFSNFSLSEDATNDYQAIVTDKNFNILNKFLKIERFSSMQIKQGNQISVLDNQTMFLPKNSVNSYIVNSKGIKTKYLFNFKENWNEDIFYKEVDSPRELVQVLNKKEIIRALGVTENDGFLLFSFWFLDDHYLATYNKEIDQLNYIKKDKNGFENRFFIKGYYQNYFISYKYHDNLKIAAKNDIECLISEDDKKMISNLNEIDNPILIFTKFKK